LHLKNQIHIPPTNTHRRNRRAGTHQAIAPTRTGRSQFRRRYTHVPFLVAVSEQDSSLGWWKSQMRNVVLPSIPLPPKGHIPSAHPTSQAPWLQGSLQPWGTLTPWT